MKNKAKIILSTVIILFLIAIVVICVNAFSKILLNADLSHGEADPMFAATPEIVTRPPELDMEEEQDAHMTLDDYVEDTLTPLENIAVHE